MAKAAKEQVAAETEGMGTPQQVRSGAGIESKMLDDWVTAAYANLNANKVSAADHDTVLVIVNDELEVASGLGAIAASTDDAGYVNAVLAMCEDSRVAAEPVVGKLEIMVAAAAKAGQIGGTIPAEQRASAAALLDSFGNVMLSIPGRCEQSKARLTEASAEEQQAEVQHQMNVNRALLAAGMVFAGTALVAGEVGAAAATRPPVQNNSVYVNQYNNYGY